MMHFNTKKAAFLALLLGAIFINFNISTAQSGLTIYSPYTRISVPPGESIEYNVDFINHGKSVVNCPIAISGLRSGWDYTLKAGGFNIQQISVLPDEKKTVKLQVQVPLKINKGLYRFNVLAKGITSLPLTVVVSKQGTYKTEFSTEQPNMQGAANAKFTFTANLKNHTADQQLYALQAAAPRGWKVTFKAKYKQVTSVSIDANKTEKITVEVDPPDNVIAGTYKIPVRAATKATSAEVALEVVITGSYDVDLSTPTGLLSTKMTAGGKKKIEVVVHNTGSAPLKDIKLKAASKPTNWDVTFDPEQIGELAPGKTAQAYATIQADKKAISGDYVVKLEAKTPETSSRPSFRVSVHTSMLWGWIGVIIIAIALWSVYNLFRKYGRR